MDVVRQTGRSGAHIAQNAAHRFCELPVFFTALRMRVVRRRRVSIARYRYSVRKVASDFFSSFQACNTPWHQESAAKWSQAGGRNRKAVPPQTTNVVLLRPSFPQPPQATKTRMPTTPKTPADQQTSAPSPSPDVRYAARAAAPKAVARLYSESRVAELRANQAERKKPHP